MALADVASPTVESAAAALLHSVVQNHPFFNGNKRAALVSMLVFLDRHNLVLESTQDQLFKFMIRIAALDLLPKNYLYDTRADREVFDIANWILKNSRPLQKSERTITWGQLAKVLPQLECLVDQSKGEKKSDAPLLVRSDISFGRGRKCLRPISSIPVTVEKFRKRS